MDIIPSLESSNVFKLKVMCKIAYLKSRIVKMATRDPRDSHITLSFQESSSVLLSPLAKLCNCVNLA